MTVYAVLDADGVITNMVMWDGKTPYDPGEGLTLVPAGDGYSIGGRIENGNYVPPVSDDGIIGRELQAS